MALLYVGSYTEQMAGRGVGISTFTRDGARLALIAELATPAPSYLAADPDRPVLYAVNELDDGSVSSYALGEDGAPRRLSTQSTGGVWPCHLTVYRGHLLAANYGSGSVSVHPIDPGGRLGTRSDLARHAGHGPRPDRQEGPHAHQVLVDRDVVTVIDLGIDRLVRYQLVDGRLLRTGESAVPSGTGPRHAVVHRAGRWYVAGELGSVVVPLHADATTGELTPVTEPVPASDVAADNLPSAIVFSADGGRLYVANRGANTIATFRIGDDGAPRMIGEVDCGGDWPRDITVVDDLLFVANERSHAVVAFRLDPDTGLPRPTGDVVEVGSPTCLLPR